MYVCLCHAVTESDLVDAIAQGADSVSALQTLTGAGTGCGSCLDELALWAARATARRLPVLGGSVPCSAPIEEERTAA